MSIDKLKKDNKMFFSQPMKKGDWNCPKCGNHNFSSRMQCRRCPYRKEKSIYDRQDKKDGDWECDHCGNMVFASKDICGLCHQGSRPAGASGKKKIQKKAGDWTCSSCQEINFGSRVVCWGCSKARTDIKQNDVAKAAIRAMEKEKNKYVKKTHELADKAGTNYPPYWSIESKKEMKLYPSMYMKTLIQGLADETTISDYIGKGRDNLGLKHKGHKILKVFRIEHPINWGKYSQHKNHILSEMSKHHPEVFTSNETRHDKMIENLDQSVNEVYLWHGTKPDIKDIVQVTGFDERVASNGLFGHGIYFAENFSKSDEYVTPDRNGICYMFLSRVCLGLIGHIKNSQMSRKRPPCLQELNGSCNGVCTHTRHHSLLAGKGPGCYLKKYREFIVYDRNQCYPEFLIEYRRV